MPHSSKLHPNAGRSAPWLQSNRHNLTLKGGQHFQNFEIVKISDAIRSFGALAHDSRLAIFRLLVKRGPAGYTPSELAMRLDVPAPTMSFYLKELQWAGLIAARREGRFIYYSAAYAQMRALIDFLNEKCCSQSDVKCDESCTPMVTKRRAG